MLFIIYLSYIFLIRPLLEARAEIQKYFRWFLVQMKSLEFAFEINWPLALHHLSQNVSLWFTSYNHGTLVRLKGEQMSAAGVGGAELGRAKACRRRRRRRRRLRLASASLYQTKAEDQAAHHRRVAKQRTVCSVWILLRVSEPGKCQWYVDVSQNNHFGQPSAMVST